MNHHAVIHSRIRMVLVGTTVVFILIALQLFSVQVVRAGAISKRAATELMSTSTVPAPRGGITDINGVSLATSVAAVTIVVDQTEITDPKKPHKLPHQF